MTIDQAKLQALLDKEEIREILYRYCRACDRADRALLESCYHPGAIEDHGAFFGEAAEFAVNLVGNAARLYQRMGHMVSTINIELDGDVAHSEAYVCAGGPLVARAADGGTQVRVIYGRYIDRFEKRDGEWRIAQRIVVKDWTDVRTVHDPVEEYALSQYGFSDPAYTHTSPRIEAGAPKQNKVTPIR
jgi:hypothetical protein